MYQCFVDMEPFICKTLLILSLVLKPFFNGQTEPIFFSIVAIS